MFQKLKRTNTDSSDTKVTPGDQVTYDKLIAMAKKMRATQPEQAYGTCLTMSLEFCSMAKKLDIPTSLVMWRVKGDPNFCDHWAVRMNPKQVIDLTRIQINPKPSSEVVFSLTDYPKQFSKPRFYTTLPLLDEYLNFKRTHPGKLPSILIKNIRNLMLKQDLSSANHFKNYLGITNALLAYLRFRFTFWLSQLEERLKKRAKELNKKLP